ncbi:HIT family protein [bacterium]|nr:HIT family protein [bacterium]
MKRCYIDGCVFCKILNGEIPSYKIFEDDFFCAILDINPISKGHVLVFPKEHYVDIMDIPDNIQSRMYILVKKLTAHIDHVYNPEGFVINQNNGEAAGQCVPHIHVHIKPIYKDTEIPEEESYRHQYSDEEMKKIYEDLALVE